jgi:DegV family protein with EDD domain
MTNCMEMGFQVLQGAKAAREGKDIEEVIGVINKVKEKGKFLFIPDTFKYLKKGGRIGGAAALVGSILQIKPILTVTDGMTTVFEKVRTKKKAIEVIENKVVKDMEQHGLGELIVHHINCEKEGLEVANRLSRRLNVPVEVESIGPIIGVHVGPGCIGIAYHTEK